ncbi:MAG: hypothetical protein ABJN22_05645 [Litorimonas sp.]
MSDITKKIFSIEQTGDAPSRSEPSTSDILRPLSEESLTRNKKPDAEDVPDFVTREAVRPLASPPSSAIDEIKPTKAAGWVIIGLGVLYVIGAGLYFGLPLVVEPLGLLSIAGLVILLTLPLVLLFLLWRALRHLSLVSQQNAQFSKAAEILVTPDLEALGRTETLAGGIQAQISKVNSGLSDTVEALEGIQTAVTRESQALEAAGLALSNRSDEVGQNLTLQRQALESMSGTFDTRMNTLSTQISDSSQALDGICSAAETKLLNAGEALEKASAIVDETVTSGSTRMAENISALEAASQKLDESANALTADLSTSTETLLSTDSTFVENSEKLQTLNAQTQAQISDLQATINQGQDMLADLKTSAETRTNTVASYYDDLSSQIKRSEDDTLAAQGQTARMVQSNLAQMRRDFSRMETDLQSLQAKLNNLRDASANLPQNEPKPSRLNLTPLDSDFPPVEPPRPIIKPDPVEIADSPLNLGMDMEIESADETLINYEPDVIRRPGDIGVKSKSKGFGRRTEKEEKSGWRWRDMLGTLERPDGSENVTSVPAALDIDAAPTRDIDGVALLTSLQLSPAAIVDEGTVVDATQARINSGEPGLTSVVTAKLPEAVTHLKENLAADAVLKSDLRAFTADFAKMIGNTPPTAPALRAAFGSPEGRAYLLCAAALKPELR